MRFLLRYMQRSLQGLQELLGSVRPAIIFWFPFKQAKRPLLASSASLPSSTLLASGRLRPSNGCHGPCWAGVCNTNWAPPLSTTGAPLGSDADLVLDSFTVGVLGTDADLFLTSPTGTVTGLDGGWPFSRSAKMAAIATGSSRLTLLADRT